MARISGASWVKARSNWTAANESSNAIETTPVPRHVALHRNFGTEHETRQHSTKRPASAGSCQGDTPETLFWFSSASYVKAVTMASDSGTPPLRDPTPTAPRPPATIPQKRALEEDHSPAVSSPLNPDVKPPPKVQIQAPEDGQSMAREKRTKKESLKKREAKGGASLSETPRAPSAPDLPLKDPSPAEVSPMRYKLAPPKPTDFDPPRGPVFTLHHSVPGLDGRDVEFFEASEQ